MVAPTPGPPITILITDRNLTVVGDPITCWETVDCTLRFNEPGSGMFVAPGYSWIRDQLDPSHRVVVIRGGQVLIAGPIERAFHERSDDGENGGVGKWTVHFGDDLAWVAGRITYPNPAQTPAAQTVDEWTFIGGAETAIRNLVNLNAGPGALTARRVPKLILGTLAGVGSSVTVRTRLEPLCDVLRTVARSGGNLGFRTRQDTATKQILFEVYAPADKSSTVRFGFGLGNLRYLGYELVAPTASTAIVGGQGTGADRFLIERTNTTAEAAWGRLETYVPRPGSSPVAELQEGGDEALAETGETARLQTAAYDTPDQRFGVHYGLGDRVSVQLWPGREVTDIVRLVHLQAWATAGELVSAMVGTQAASHDPVWVRRLRELDRRTGRLERTVLPAA